MNIEQIVDFAQANSDPEHYSPAPRKPQGRPETERAQPPMAPPAGSSTPVSGKAPWDSDGELHRTRVPRDHPGRLGAARPARQRKTVRAGDRFVIPCRLPGHLGK